MSSKKDVEKLFEACDQGNLSVVKEMIKKKVNLNSKGEKG